MLEKYVQVDPTIVGWWVGYHAAQECINIVTPIHPTIPPYYLSPISYQLSPFPLPKNAISQAVAGGSSRVLEGKCAEVYPMRDGAR